MLIDLEKTKESIRYPACFIAFGFGVGLLRIMPGTLSTLLVGLPLYHLLNTLPRLAYSVVLIVMIILGVFVCSIAEEVLDSADDSTIVWDEICGYLCTMIAAPQGFPWPILGFLLFRFFDIFKPWPIDISDKYIKGGLGIMLDDVLAAIYASATLFLFSYFL